ncbi:hypothetical protein R6Q59_023181 [Mikania micrantha]
MITTELALHPHSSTISTAAAVEQDHIQDQGLEPAAESAAIAVEQDPVEDQEQESVMANESKTNEVEGGQEEQEEETSAQGVPRSEQLLGASNRGVLGLGSSISGEKIDAAEELDASSSENNGVASNLNHMKRWFLSHAQYLNFFTILVLASVPNPLFDLAGIMCGQFGIPFWKFFFATLFGKAIVKTHIQTVFIISVCNNQLLYWIENELIWMLSFIPGVASALPNIVAKLHAEKYMAAPLPVTSNIKVKSWGLSFASIWNSIVWLMLFNFFVKIVNSTAQRYLKKQQENEICALKKKLDEDQDSH